jgi:hypothetical protein
MSCWPGSAPERVALRGSDARAPADTQNATRARSRCEPSRVNSSLNTVSGICFGTRCGTFGRNRPAFCFGNASIGLWCACARPGRASGNGFTIGPGPGLQVIGVEAAADRLAVHHRRRREPSRRRPLPRHRLGRGRLSPGLAGELEVPAEVPGLDPRRLVPRDIHGPGEPEPAQQRQRLRPLRRRGPPGRLQVPQELRHRHDPPAARAAQAVRLPQVPGLDKRPCCGNHQRSEIPDRVCLFSRHGTRP